jgi:hypothetical protein
MQKRYVAMAVLKPVGLHTAALPVAAVRTRVGGPEVAVNATCKKHELVGGNVRALLRQPGFGGMGLMRR